MSRLFTLIVLAAVAPLAWSAPLTPVESLGKALFFDEALSDPPGQSCATCHGPEAGFSGPDSEINATTAAYPGAVATRFSNRKPPTAMYAAETPILHLENEEGDAGEDAHDHAESHVHELAEGELWVGGLFFDGRAHGWLLQDPLAEQAQGPFLNPLEQNLPDAASVVDRVRDGHGDRFTQLFGPDALDAADPQAAYDLIAQVIAAYERSVELNPFSSKYDHYLRGEASLTAQEQHGLELFEGKALCSECHPSQLGPNGEPPLFTDFTYDNLGVPRNEDLPFYAMPAAFNPDGAAYEDPGLGGFLATHPAWAHLAADNWGKHKVPTLRNVDARPDPDFVKVYMHNGVFDSLAEVVEFYNTRDVGDWPPPEVAQNVNVDELGDLKLTPEEEAAIVAFMQTLTDGYRPAP
jgi:cytochrome c peroxidase